MIVPRLCGFWKLSFYSSDRAKKTELEFSMGF